MGLTLIPSLALHGPYAQNTEPGLAPSQYNWVWPNPYPQENKKKHKNILLLCQKGILMDFYFDFHFFNVIMST